MWVRELRPKGLAGAWQGVTHCPTPPFCGVVGTGCILFCGGSDSSIYNALNEVRDNLICTSITSLPQGLFSIVSL